MASVKRKGSTDDSSSKASNKRPKTDTKPKTRISTIKDKDGEQTTQLAARSKQASLLTKEQPAFPRGGGGLLTPLERKQIQAKANRDVAAEQARSSDLFGGRRTARGDSDSEDESIADDSEPKAKMMKPNKAKTKVKQSKAVPKEDTIAIEGLSYKRLAVASQILGCISSVNPSNLTIALPNNLTGYVSLTNISPQFTDKLQKALNEQAEESDIEDDTEIDDDDILLEKHFQVGQYIRTVVTSLESEQGGKGQAKRRIELSLNPGQVNAGLSKNVLSTGSMIQASVASVEDHGLIMHLSLSDGDNVKGFIPNKALKELELPMMAKVGAVFLCQVTSLAASGKTVTLSPNLTKPHLVKNALSVDALLPGTLVEVLLSEVTNEGLVGKVMGLVDATADIVQSGSFEDRESFLKRFKIGERIKGRLLFTLPLSENKKLGFSVLPKLVDIEKRRWIGDGLELQASSIIDAARVVRVASGLGIYLSLPHDNVGFAHISRLSDKKVDSIGESLGAYKLGSEHKARVLDFSSMDGLYILSLQKSVLDQPYLRVEDVPVGDVVKATIEKVIIGPHGVSGLLVKLADGITGLVPQIHLSDIALLHPEKKFREGGIVAARVLSVDKGKRQIRLTLKKTLVNSDQRIWSSFEEIAAGDATVGTLVKVDPQGALVQFYGDVKGFLPVSEMSEAYIKDAKDHFKVGQVLTVSCISVNAADSRLTVSCRERSVTTESALASIIPGSLVVGTVFEKSQNDLLLRLEGSDVIARIALDHMSDGSERKRRSALDKLRVGQRLENVLVLELQRKSRLVVLSNKQTLVKAAQNGEFLNDYADLQQDAILTGFISNITDDGVFVRFAHGITGLIPKGQVSTATIDEPNFGLQLLQAVTAKVMTVDYKGATPRFWLTMREGPRQNSQTKSAQLEKPVIIPDIIEAVDESITAFEALVPGKVTKARITSVKETQINVELAKDIQGRIDVSEVFDSWDDISDRKQPLKKFSPKQVIEVKILGAHDTRNHRFLPLTHRTGKHTVFELTAKPSSIKATNGIILSLSSLKLGSSWLAYVNNIVENYLMVNISPSIRGRIKAMDVADDLNLASDLAGNFPVGSALRVKVLAVDEDKGRLDLTGRSTSVSKVLTLEELAQGMILPGRVTRVTDRSILVQLGDTLVGAVDLVDMADDFTLADPAKYEKNDVVRVAVLRVDLPNKKVVLSTRPSKILSSSLQVDDPEITVISQLHVNDVVRGFISNVSEKGVFVSLGHGVTGFCRVTNLSDSFLKNWKDHFQRDQLVQAKVILVDAGSGHVQLSFKKSLMDANYKPPHTFATLHVGDIVTGKVAKVEPFGVFIVVDNSENVRGLCHRSEIAQKRVEDASTLFNEGDKVKAIVLKIDLPNRRINFGMKASYFADIDDEMEDAVTGDSDEDEDHAAHLEGGVTITEASSDYDDTDLNIEMGLQETDGEGVYVEDSDNSNQHLDLKNDEITAKKTLGLSVGGFDWFGMPDTAQSLHRNADTAFAVDDSGPKHKKKRKRAEIQIDQTGDLDVNGPQSPDDFERLLLGEPDSSMLWLQYMAFHLELGDVDQARQIGERALKSISLGQDAGKMNIWIALLNLENTYGDNESIDAIFKRACEYNDPQEIYQRLISIYIQSGKHDKADNLFQDLLKRFTQDPKLYVNYANFQFDTLGEADRGRALLSRALQVLPPFTHFDLTSKFAQMEFKSSAGLAERGRTIFEGLINSFPKRIDLFNIMLDMETQYANKSDEGMAEEAKEQIRALFERIFTRQLKPKQAKYFFKRWLAFEEKNGHDRQIEEVKAKAATWVKKSAQP